MARRKPRLLKSIEYPTRGVKVGPQFHAFGHVPKDKVGALVEAVLIDPKKPAAPPIAGKTLREPPHWIAVFDKVPPGKYGLVLRHVSKNGVEALSFGKVTNLTVKKSKVKKAQPQATKVPAPPAAGVIISFPTDGAILSTSFIATGKSGDFGPISGVMVASGGTTIQGITVQAPSSADPSWIIQFTGVPPSAMAGIYSLVVTTSAGSSATASRLTVR
jgi:hypothetical protein